MNRFGIFTLIFAVLLSLSTVACPVFDDDGTGPGHSDSGGDHDDNNDGSDDSDDGQAGDDDGDGEGSSHCIVGVSAVNGCTLAGSEGSAL